MARKGCSGGAEELAWPKAMEPDLRLGLGQGSGAAVLLSGFAVELEKPSWCDAHNVVPKPRSCQIHSQSPRESASSNKKTPLWWLVDRAQVAWLPGEESIIPQEAVTRGPAPGSQATQSHLLNAESHGVPGGELHGQHGDRGATNTSEKLESFGRAISHNGLSCLRQERR